MSTLYYPCALFSYISEKKEFLHYFKWHDLAVWTTYLYGGCNCNCLVLMYCCTYNYYCTIAFLSYVDFVPCKRIYVTKLFRFPFNIKNQLFLIFLYNFAFIYRDLNDFFVSYLLYLNKYMSFTPKHSSMGYTFILIIADHS